MKRTRSLDPANRLGDFKRFTEFAEHHRFEQHADEYHASEMWLTFCETHVYDNRSNEQLDVLKDDTLRIRYHPIKSGCGQA